MELIHAVTYSTTAWKYQFTCSLCRKKGFKKLYTLKGGVSHYLENEGPVEWVGNLFVFDSRLSLPPAAYNPRSTAQTCDLQHAFKNEKFAKCYLCGSVVQELRHRNCANLDCNLLFLWVLYCLSFPSDLSTTVLLSVLVSQFMDGSQISYSNLLSCWK